MRNEHSYTVGEKSWAGFEQAALVHMRCICIDERPHCSNPKKNEMKREKLHTADIKNRP